MRITLKNHSEVAHVWASQSQSEGKSGNMFFDDDTIYSYGRHFKIAKFQTMPNGEKCVLFNADSYSNSTSKHQNYTHRAIPDNYTVFTIPDGLWPCFDSVMAWYLERIDNAFELSKRARTYALMNYHSAMRYIEKMELYAEYNNQPCKYELSDDQKAIKARAESQEETNAERTKIREAAAEQKRLEEIEELKTVCGGDVVEYWRKHGCLPQGYSAYQHLPQTVCRIVDGEVLTSMGARVPVEHVKRVLPVIIRCRKNKTEWKANGEQIRIGHYSFNKISSDGDIHVGCHYILWSEVEYIAKQLNVI